MSLGIYIQVPFCQTKCTYCNFHTGVVSSDRYAPYADALCREISECTSRSGNGSVAAAFRPASLLWGRRLSSDIPGRSGDEALAPEVLDSIVDTVYFGGGTPSLLEPAALEKIVSALRGSFQLSAEPEITLEADPETITPEKSSAWLRAGFNRISLGAQSFDARELQFVGRMHRRADIFCAIEILRSAGFANISMDLIAGLPHQTHESWEASVTELLRLRPEHTSIYMLEIDEGSRLGRESLAGGARYSAQAVPNDDAIADFYESACARLADASYDHYEISNWALPSFRSRHNLKYWRREPYLGFGAGAHSFDGRARWANAHDSARYVALVEQGISPREQFEILTPAQALEEELFLGLRQLEGIDLQRIERAYGVPLAARIAPLRSQGLVEFDGTRLRLSPARLAVSNEVFVSLLG
jgi:putative oxygen-independent coproporphyrinogen III oxidase